MEYHLKSNRPEIKLSEVTIKKILTEADIFFKFVVLQGKEVAYTSEIECINLQVNVQMYQNEDKLTFEGEKADVIKIVSLVKDYYGSLSDFILTDKNDKNSLPIAGHTSEKEMKETF
jgi:hypothetical protein